MHIGANIHGLCRLGGDSSIEKRFMTLRRMNIATEWEEGFGAYEVVHYGKVAVVQSLAHRTRGWSSNTFEGLWNPLAGFRTAVGWYAHSADPS